MGTALGAALEVGDDEAALAADALLKPLLPGIDAPFLRAVFQLAMAWCAPITGDFDGALQAATESLEQLRALDEPFWTALAVGSLGTVEKILDAGVRLNRQQAIAAVRLAQTSPAADQTRDY